MFDGDMCCSDVTLISSRRYYHPYRSSLMFDGICVALMLPCYYLDDVNTLIDVL